MLLHLSCLFYILARYVRALNELHNPPKTRMSTSRTSATFLVQLTNAACSISAWERTGRKSACIFLGSSIALVCGLRVVEVECKGSNRSKQFRKARLIRASCHVRARVRIKLTICIVIHVQEIQQSSTYTHNCNWKQGIKETQ